MSMVREEIAQAGLLAKLGAALMQKPLRALKRKTDYAEYGGAPLLGIDGVALICHGGSSARAIASAVRVAGQFAQIGLGSETTAAIAAHAFLWDSAWRPGPGVAGALS